MLELEFPLFALELDELSPLPALEELEELPALLLDSPPFQDDEEDSPQDDEEVTFEEEDEPYSDEEEFSKLLEDSSLLELESPLFAELEELEVFPELELELPTTTGFIRVG